jgi:peroxiredoxin
MIAVGDTAPDFTAPLANGTVDQFTLSDAVSEQPVVLAFFPAAFTSTCSHEMSTFQDRLGEFADTGAEVYGVSIDTPFTLNEFRDQLGLEFGLVSDTNREIVDTYDISMDFESSGVRNLAKRAVYVVDTDQSVSYAWVSDDPGVEPDYDDVLEAVRDD